MPLLSLQPSDACFKKVQPPTRVFHEQAGEPTGHRAFHGVNDGITFGGSGDGTLDRHDARSFELFLPQDKSMGNVGGLDSAWTTAMEFTSLESLSQHVYQNGNLFGEASSVVY